MRAVAEKPKKPQQTTPAKSTLPNRTHCRQSYEVNSILRLQRKSGTTL